MTHALQTEPRPVTSPTLFSPFTCRGVTLRNRVGVSPMCQYSSVDGFANDWHYLHLGSRAVGGAGLVFTEATAVTADGRISPADLGIWKDEHVESLARCVRLVGQHGAVPGIQLAHAGRKASTSPPWLGGKPVGPEDGGWRPIWAPSAVAFGSHSPVPEALSEGQIADVVRAFADAAVRAREAGFKVVELHGAHGYLLHEFLSPLSNQRTDGYGGSFRNRIRLACEVVDATRAVWPEDLLLFFRISATDWVDGGWDLEQSVELSRVLKARGVDVIDCSSGGVVPGATIPVGPGYQTPFAETLHRDAGVATAAVGLITAPEQAEHVVRTGQADLVLLARAVLRDPYWPMHAARKLGQEHPWPVQYERARD